MSVSDSAESLSSLEISCSAISSSSIFVACNPLASVFSAEEFCFPTIADKTK